MSTRPIRIYLIGSLRNPAIPELAKRLRAEGFEVFDDWHAAGATADDAWKEYEELRGRGYIEALQGHAAKHVFDFDLTNLRKSDVAVLVLPAGKSAHIELGWMLGQGKFGYILLDEVARWDVMYLFANGVCATVEDLIEALPKRMVDG